MRNECRFDSDGNMCFEHSGFGMKGQLAALCHVGAKRENEKLLLVETFLVAAEDRIEALRREIADLRESLNDVLFAWKVEVNVNLNPHLRTPAIKRAEALAAAVKET